MGQNLKSLREVCVTNKTKLIYAEFILRHACES